MQKMSHPFHEVSLSPWPIILSSTLLSISMFIISYLMKNTLSLMYIILVAMIAFWMSMLWWRDLKRESSFQGHHEIKIMNLLKYSMIMFISSEVMFFFSFFWAFFNSSVSPNIELGMSWPPQGISIFQPMEMPLLNSIILLSSGASITWSHHSYLEGNMNNSFISMLMTIALGIMFTVFQSMEYYEAKFSFSDSVYGSTFFITTGFHGIHVIIGTLFLTVTLVSIFMMTNSNTHFICFDLSAWYWHFVDIVWLFLFMSIYWWGS